MSAEKQQGGIKPQTPTNISRVIHDRDISLKDRIRLGLPAGIAISWSLFHIYTSYFGILEAWRHRALTLTFVLVLSFLYYPSKGRKLSSLKGVCLNIFDKMGLILSVILGCYTWFAYEGILDRVGIPDTFDLIFGVIAIVLVIEITRRTVGNGMAILAAGFVLYMLFGHLIPGSLGIPKIAFIKLIDTMFNSTYGIFSLILGVMSTFIIIFVIFGGFLLHSQAGDFFINLAYSLTGHRIGGPAKVSVVGSGFMGMVSGAAAANVVTTGTFTIPLMKRVGYSPVFSGAVEAAASMGGQFMPPIMGAAAFLIAEQLRMPYVDLCLYALAPALLHFFAVGTMVHFEAQRKNLPRLNKEDLSSSWDILKRQGHLLLPVIIIIGFLVKGYTPQISGFWAIISVVVLTGLKKETRMRWDVILSALETGAKNAISIAAVCACAGIIVGTVIMTGLGLKLSRMVLYASDGNIFLGLFFIMIASIILGMGMTTVSAYVILGVLGVPALVKMGVLPLAAHLFVFYFAIFSNVTPPVAVSAYAAAGISRGDPFKTAMEGFRICLGTLLLPYMFVFNTGLLMQGSVLSIITAVVTAVVGIFCLTASLQGWLLVALDPALRLLTGLTALLLVYPQMMSHVAGFILFLIIGLLQRRKWTSVSRERFPLE